MKDFLVKCLVKSTGTCSKGIVHLRVLVMPVFEYAYAFIYRRFVARGNYNVLVCLRSYSLDRLYKMNIFVKYGDTNVGVI